MRIPRIFTTQELQINANIQLEPGPSQHLSRALRMKPGDNIILFDGTGGQYPATISTLGRTSVVAITADFDPVERESGLSVHLGIALSRGERMDWIVQKATELGVSAITPLRTERTEVRLSGERAEKKLRHWQQIATSACEQCGRNRLPDIQPTQNLAQWVNVVEADARLVLHHRANSARMDATSPSSIALLVGPEGGLSPGEITAAEQAQFLSLQLGPRILRTETAPLAAIAILQGRWGDMASP